MNTHHVRSFMLLAWSHAVHLDCVYMLELLWKIVPSLSSCQSFLVSSVGISDVAFFHIRCQYVIKSLHYGWPCGSNFRISLLTEG